MTTITRLTPDVAPPRHPFELSVRRLFRNPASVIGLLIILVMLLCAVAAPVIAPYDPILGDLANDYVKPPSTVHLFGTDAIGRDILTRVIYGAQISLKIALAAQAIAIAIGVVMGMISGFFGGWIDVLISRIVD